MFNGRWHATCARSSAAAARQCAEVEKRCGGAVRCGAVRCKCGNATCVRKRGARAQARSMYDIITTSDVRLRRCTAHQRSSAAAAVRVRVRAGAQRRQAHLTRLLSRCTSLECPVYKMLPCHAALLPLARAKDSHHHHHHHHGRE